ncbi:MAG TPA: hypothetical protein PKU68_04540 [Bacillota bacterium]|nr:hypothetical protein [Bacillota bacterium]
MTAFTAKGNWNIKAVDRSFARLSPTLPGTGFSETGGESEPIWFLDVGVVWR